MVNITIEAKEIIANVFSILIIAKVYILIA